MNLSMTNERVLLYAKCFLEEKINTYQFTDNNPK